MPKLIIIGGGLAGLTAAYEAETRGIEYVLLERGARVGGLVQTERVDGFVIDRGPESIITDKPAGVGLARALGLESELVGTVPQNRGAFVVRA